MAKFTYISLAFSTKYWASGRFSKGFQGPALLPEIVTNHFLCHKYMHN